MSDTEIACQHVWKIFGDRAQEAMTMIQAEGLSKAEVLDRYECVVGVADATFSVAKGEIFCIMGLSGSGKSTLIRHINRLIEPTAGTILINDEDINQKSEEELRQIRSLSVSKSVMLIRPNAAPWRKRNWRWFNLTGGKTAIRVNSRVACNSASGLPGR